MTTCFLLLNRIFHPFPTKPRPSTSLSCHARSPPPNPELASLLPPLFTGASERIYTRRAERGQAACSTSHFLRKFCQGPLHRARSHALFQRCLILLPALLMATRPRIDTRTRRLAEIRGLTPMKQAHPLKRTPRCIRNRLQEIGLLRLDPKLELGCVALGSVWRPLIACRLGKSAWCWRRFGLSPEAKRLRFRVGAVFSRSDSGTRTAARDVPADTLCAEAEAWDETHCSQGNSIALNVSTRTLVHFS